MNKILVSMWIFLSLIGCDESGRFTSDAIGKWELMGDSVKNENIENYTTPGDWGKLSDLLTLSEDGDLLVESVYPDSTYRYTGRWYETIGKIHMVYDDMGKVTRGLEFRADTMLHVYTFEEAGLITRHTWFYTPLE